MHFIQKLADELQKEGCKEKMSCYRCDVTKENDVIKMFEKINAEHGGIDVLINNAGLTRDAPLLSGDVASWNLMLQVSGMKYQRHGKNTKNNSVLLINFFLTNASTFCRKLAKLLNFCATSLRSKKYLLHKKIRITFNQKRNKNTNLPELAELTKKSNVYSATKGNQ